MRKWTSAAVLVGLAVVAVGAWQQGTTVHLDVRINSTAEDALTVAGGASIAGWAGIRVIGADDGTCPDGFAVDTTFEGRMIVGTPSGGTNGGLSGPVLTDLEVRRGGTAAGLAPGGPTQVAYATSNTSQAGNHTHSVISPFATPGGTIVWFSQTPQEAFYRTTINATRTTTSAGNHTHTAPTLNVTPGAAPSYTDQLQPAPFIQVPICEYRP